MSRLLLRLIGRELWRGELRAVVLALALSVACVLSVALVADRLQQTLTQGGREFLAGDLQLRSAETVPDAWLAAARQQGLAWSQTLVFNSMLFHEDALQLASIKAVGPGYPFYGQLQLEPTRHRRRRPDLALPRADAALAGGRWPDGGAGRAGAAGGWAGAADTRRGLLACLAGPPAPSLTWRMPSAVVCCCRAAA